MNPPPKHIRRVCYTKTGKVRFISHRDLARCWERSLRKAGVAVAYSQGFSPRPRIAFGLALPTGYESTAEYLDIELEPDRASAPLESFAAMVNETLPSGMCVLAVGDVSHATSLQEAVTSCIWEVRLAAGDRSAIEESIAAVLDADELLIERERKGKKVVDNIRPLITELEVRGESALCIHADLGTKPRALRPDELLRIMSISLSDRVVVRTAQLIDTELARLDPLSVDAVSVVHA
ncbi:MAG: DUF2344 domain-containing protein [Acidobacteria bacterium]|nr:DUF2344 domain-containing protein [Acidobacteriota bacterium]